MIKYVRKNKQTPFHRYPYSPVGTRLRGWNMHCISKSEYRRIPLPRCFRFDDVVPFWRNAGQIHDRQKKINRIHAPQLLRYAIGLHKYCFRRWVYVNVYLYTYNTLVRRCTYSPLIGNLTGLHWFSDLYSRRLLDFFFLLIFSSEIRSAERIGCLLALQIYRVFSRRFLRFFNAFLTAW